MFSVYQLPLIGVVGDRQAKEVSLLHVVWAYPDLPCFQSGAVSSCGPVHPPRETGCGIRPRTDRPTHPAWEGWLPAPTTGTAEIPGRSLMAQPRSPAITIAFKADSFVYFKALAVLARPLLQVLQPVGVGGDADRSWVRFPSQSPPVFCPRTWGRWSPGVLGSCPA